MTPLLASVLLAPILALAAVIIFDTWREHANHRRVMDSFGEPPGDPLRRV